MTDSVDFYCVVAPKGAGETRVPGLVMLAGGCAVLFFDERPALTSDMGSDFNGLMMASDLLNPNRILWMKREGSRRWSKSRPLPAGGPSISPDTCIGVDDDGFTHLAFTSTDGCVGCMDSRTGGERLCAQWAWGSGSEDFAYMSMTDEPYELTGVDVLFAVSGGAVTLDGAVALPYAVRMGDGAHVCVTYIHAGRFVGAADPLVGDGKVLLGETMLGVWDGRLVVNCHLQGFGG